jgi:hypothetical protein
MAFRNAIGFLIGSRGALQHALLGFDELEAESGPKQTARPIVQEPDRVIAQHTTIYDQVLSAICVP